MILLLISLVFLQKCLALNLHNKQIDGGFDIRSPIEKKEFIEIECEPPHEYQYKNLNLNLNHNEYNEKKKMFLSYDEFMCISKINENIEKLQLLNYLKSNHTSELDKLHQAILILPKPIYIYNLFLGLDNPNLFFNDF
jgi:hypothetical protein